MNKITTAPRINLNDLAVLGYIFSRNKTEMIREDLQDRIKKEFQQKGYPIKDYYANRIIDHAVWIGFLKSDGYGKVLLTDSGVLFVMSSVNNQ